MPRILWAHQNDQPNIHIVLSFAVPRQEVVRHLLADTGAGTARAGFELILLETDCLQAGGSPAQPVSLGGAYEGSYPVYVVRVKIPVLGFDQHVRIIGVSTVPPGLDGIAGFRFLNRFTYGNFGDTRQFGLEV
jgi:hypothetical protein